MSMGGMLDPIGMPDSMGSADGALPAELDWRQPHANRPATMDATTIRRNAFMFVLPVPTFIGPVPATPRGGRAPLDGPVAHVLTRAGRMTVFLPFHCSRFCTLNAMSL